MYTMSMWEPSLGSNPNVSRWKGLYFTDVCLLFSEPQDAPKSRKNKHKDNIPAPYEMEARQIEADPRHRMKALLPIKHSEGLEYRWEEKRKIDDDDEDDDDEKKDGRLFEVEVISWNMNEYEFLFKIW